MTLIKRKSNGLFEIKHTDLQPGYSASLNRWIMASSFIRFMLPAIGGKLDCMIIAEIMNDFTPPFNKEREKF